LPSFVLREWSWSLVEIEKAAHMIAGDRNDGFAEEAIKFLRSL